MVFEQISFTHKKDEEQRTVACYRMLSTVMSPYLMLTRLMSQLWSTELPINSISSRMWCFLGFPGWCIINTKHDSYVSKTI